MIYIKDLMSGIDIFKALSSEIRIQILELLAGNQALNLNEIAKKLNLSNGAITMHIKKLEESGLIEINTSVGKHGIQKVCYLNKDKLMVDLRSKDVDNLYEVEIQVGHYSNYQAVPTCGLATKDSIIGDFDEPRYFADPQRIDSEIIWMAEGFLEYRIPNYLKANQTFREIQFSMEIGSEAPGFSDNYPSDLYFYLNGIEIGYWTSPGDFGDQRGTFNPDWWPPHLNQYGMLKLIRINNEGSFIDGCRISDITLDDIKLDYKSELTFRIAVTDKPVNKRGLTIYGKHFGNYSQDLLARVLYNVHEVEEVNRRPATSTAE
ncbi:MULTISPECIES: winged helix-turn-helix transcriptional regulator [unclassified Paenibacillus]|uniref:ArsR/SmtB family transcription factor n=1 Tax=unclassified Paenibacillus TaxID=185978 RepID=UPI00240728EE|nr:MULTISPECIES: winged helix-turn-helix transcriptional regulator [unclassified Paenibacillus]MDF9841582.1 putative transcriptional regulator [Paenibacillus sp. PastF-2]MDF9848306.1 putative transcriptional regulator [Paenibacillus sp. PastM-2]MDF9854741.1 putative transcriptional regulator [Paenibacillus sp. PastF-1]MDH6480011.1 putative transcriptional regulator [Paenibacillus sp. PastH-2]MDH6507444.1 putative transcriptional regulator [Paenibacillus sp. PastM-3]